MRFTSLFVAVAGASLAAAQQSDYVSDYVSDYPGAPGDESTTTQTRTTTSYLTVTRCNPTVTDCPYDTPTTTSTTVIETPTTVAHNTSTSCLTSTTKPWPVHNTTSHVGPTGGVPTTIITATPPPDTSTDVVTATSSGPGTVPTGAAGMVMAQTGFLAAAVAAALAVIC